MGCHCTENGKEKDEGNHSLPGTWPLGVQLPTSHPPGCPCRKRQELLKEEHSQAGPEVPEIRDRPEFPWKGKVLSGLLRADSVGSRF